MKSLYIIIAVIFSFKSFGQIPSNDLCVNAQAIVLVNGQACINSTNLNATSDNQTSAAGTCDVGTPGNEVWYTFVATEANNVIT